MMIILGVICVIVLIVIIGKNPSNFLWAHKFIIVTAMELISCENVFHILYTYCIYTTI